jgi:hypothetical protein
MGRTGFIWLRIGQMAGFCEHGNEPSGTVKSRLLFDRLSVQGICCTME